MQALAANLSAPPHLLPGALSFGAKSCWIRIRGTLVPSSIESDTARILWFPGRTRR